MKAETASRSPMTEVLARAPGPLIALVVGILYVASAQYAIVLNDPVGAGAGFWPPAGVSIAALLLLPKRSWGWVLGAVGAAEIGGDILQGYPASAYLWWAAGNMIEPLIAASLVLRFGGGRHLTPVRNLLDFVLFAVLVGPLFGAMIGGIGTAATFGTAYPEVVLKWLVGDGLGVLVVAPLLLSMQNWTVPASRKRKLEAAILALLVLVTASAAFIHWGAQWQAVLPTLTAPVLIWAGLRFGLAGAAAAGFVIAQSANLATGLGFGSFGLMSSPQEQMITSVQVFMGISLLTGLVVAALASELEDRTEVQRVLAAKAEELRQSEARLRDYAEAASDWFWEMDDQFRFTRHIGGASNHDGRRPLDVIGKTRWQFARASQEDERWQEHIRCLQEHKPFRDFRYSTTDDANVEWHLSASGRPVFDSTGKFLGYRGVSADTSQRDRLEAELRQAQKMEAMGQLTGGVAHDFNNLLTVIIGNAETLRTSACDPDQTRRMSGAILKAAEHGAELTQSLLAFGRKQPLRSVPLDLVDVLGAMVPLIRRTVGEHIEVRTEFAEGGTGTVADRGLLESAILNLAVNSRDAMPKGGALTLKAGGGAGAGDTSDSTPSNMVHFTVTDTGIGMPEDVLARVFEPFFTTKDVGKGSGLGLPMVHGFANQSGGHVAVTSKPGQGTTVTVALPAAPDQQPREEEDAAASPLQPASERILVVEDEPMLLQLVTTQLESLGYRVTGAPDGAAAVAILEADDGFDLLLTDLVLPNGMSGGDVARIARDIKPGLKIVFTSGHSTENLQQHAPQAAATPLLRKPYKRKQLAELVRNVLEGITAPLPSDDHSRG